MSLLITTSRYPTRRTRTFCKDFVSVIPRSAYITRGHANLIDIASYAKLHNFTHFGIVSVWKGNPGKIMFYKITGDTYMQVSPIMYLKGVATTKDLKRPRFSKRNISTLCFKIKSVFPFMQELAEIFNAKIIHSDESYNCDIICVFKPMPKDILKLKFIHFILSEEQYVEVGPILKIKLMDVPRNVSLSSNT